LFALDAEQAEETAVCCGTRLAMQASQIPAEHHYPTNTRKLAGAPQAQQKQIDFLFF